MSPMTCLLGQITLLKERFHLIGPVWTELYCQIQGIFDLKEM